MEPQFWHARWQSDRIGFHQSAPNAHLQRWWPTLGLTAGARVLVPLCGKSADMRWLHDEGYGVVGVELSELACAAFFEEQSLPYAVATHGDYKVFRGEGAGEGLSVIQGDFFACPAELVGPVEAVFDRASLIALPPELRPAHARQLARLLPAGAPGLLVTIAYPQDEKQGPPFSVPTPAVRALLEPDFAVSAVADLDALQGPDAANRWGLSELREQVHTLRRTPLTP